MRKRDVSRAFGIDAKAAGQDPDRPIDPKAQGRPVSAPAAVQVPAPARFDEDVKNAIKNYLGKMPANFAADDEASSKKFLPLPPTLEAATSFLRTLAAFDGKTTEAEESVRVFGKTIEELGTAIRRRDFAEKAEQDKKTLASADARYKEKNPDVVEQIVEEADPVKLIEENRKVRENLKNEDKTITELIDEQQKLNEQIIEDGSIVGEAVGQAEEHIDALAETQEKHTDALTGLTDSLAG